MATLYTNGIEELLLNLLNLAQLPKDVIKSMVKAEGEVIKKAQAEHAASELHGPYYKGHIHDNIMLKPVTATSGGAKTYVTWKASITDEHHYKATRVAEIAFINQYGTKVHQAARPFISNANTASEEEAVAAAEAIFNNFIESQGF